MYLEKIDAPQDLRGLTTEQLHALADEIRETLLRKLSAHGGHIGPNLGMVEATIALHRVFDSPKDKIIYDVSHQSYVHKMLTGRREAFLDPADYDEVSGYTNPQESEHDHFTIGHTSTSVSLACGLAKARDLRGGSENVIAVIGDGSLSGGEAYEGLSNAGEAGTNLIVVVNDNEMSIAENHGGLYANLRELRESDGKAPCNFFRALGLDYLYVKEGNDIEALTAAFRQVKDTPRPVVVHIRTLKGKGYAPAERQKERFHWGMPFDLATGEPKAAGGGEDYCDLTGRFLLERMRTQPELVAITSGTPAVMGFTPERRREAGRQLVDVGIAEEHAVALASGIAKAGGRPVYGVYSTFIQRCYDQLSQDLCINGNPAVIAVFMGTAAGMNDATHLGFFDIPLLANIPNLVYLAPTCAEEYFAMLDWAIRQREHPVAVRVPGAAVVHPRAVRHGIRRTEPLPRGAQGQGGGHPGARVVPRAGRGDGRPAENRGGNRRDAGESALHHGPRRGAAGGAAARSPGGRHAGGRLAGRRFRREDRPAVRPHADAGAELRTPQGVRRPLRPRRAAAREPADRRADRGGRAAHRAIARGATRYDEPGGPRAERD